MRTIISLFSVAAAFVFLASAPVSAKKLSDCDAAASMAAEVNEAVIMCGADFDVTAIYRPKIMSIITTAASCLESDQTRNGERGKSAFDYLAATLGTKRACDTFISQLR